jgi:hypothetical protein
LPASLSQRRIAGLTTAGGRVTMAAPAVDWREGKGEDMNRAIGSGSTAAVGGALCALLGFVASQTWPNDHGPWPTIVSAAVGLLTGAVVGAAGEIVQAINAQGERIARAAGRLAAPSPDGPRPDVRVTADRNPPRSSLVLPDAPAAGR